jgi:putative proteasome-type protease
VGGMEKGAAATSAAGSTWFLHGSPRQGFNSLFTHSELPCHGELGLDGTLKLATSFPPINSDVRGQGMTYCCGVLVRDGLVMIADTRTNAGLDNVSTFRKLHIFSKPGERIMAVASAGNLAISQSVLSTLTEGVEDPLTGELETLMNAPTMFQAAQRIGRAIRSVHANEGAALQSEDVSFDVSFLFGGQIKGSRMRLFMIYTAGNFIECTTDTPYLQIGEHKYGKPVLDRAMHYDVELYEALKTSLISMDSTMRSNIGVGLPIDVLVVRTDVCDADLNHRIEAGEPYFHDLRSRWSAALRAAHQNIPRPPYKTEPQAKT